MSYHSIDPIINEWVSRNSLHLYRKYQDAEVRAVRIIDSQGRIYAIGVDPPDKEGRIKVRANAWDFKKRNKEYLANTENLNIILGEALLLVREWMRLAPTGTDQ